MADFSGDGLIDIFVPVYRGESAILYNQGGFQFELSIIDVERAFSGCAVDFNRDGNLDLFVESRTEHDEIGTDHVLLLGDGVGGFEDVAAIAGLTGSENQGMAMGLACTDLDADGLVEIVIGTGRPAVGEVNRLYRTVRLDSEISPVLGLDVPIFEDRSQLLDFAPPEPSTPPYPSYPYRTHGIIIWDFDNDGRVDIFVGNGGMGRPDDPVDLEPNRLFRHDANLGDGWLEIVLGGNAPNTQGIGARIEVTPEACEPGVSSAPRYYWVLAGNGFNGHAPLWTRAGFAGCASASVTVLWPGGDEREYASFVGGARITLEEAF
jgi:hypothetical protein